MTFFTSCSISGEIRSAVRIGALARVHLASASCQKGQWLLFLPFIYYERSSRSLIFRGAKSQAVSELRFRSRRTMNRRKDAADNSLPAVSDPAMWKRERYYDDGSDVLMHRAISANFWIFFTAICQNFRMVVLNQRTIESIIRPEFNLEIINQHSIIAFKVNWCKKKETKL